MKILSIIFLIGLTFANPIHATSESYLKRFMAYMEWSQNLPRDPSPEFLAFINEDTPLAQKLRGKWLYQLALQKDWSTYLTYYKTSTDSSLQCYQGIARFYQDMPQEPEDYVKKLWLSGVSQPPACNKLFDLVIKIDPHYETLLTQRIILALEQRNLVLARYLLKQYKQPRVSQEKQLITIHQNPYKINQLGRDELSSYFYLYGLKRMIALNMEKAIKYWQEPLTQHRLTERQKQAFLIQLVTYKAMRNQDDTTIWFNKIKPAYYNEALIEWQIRFAIHQRQWQRIESLITRLHDTSPCWQYWLARSFEAEGHQSKATPLYQSLAQTRSYYGFLSSLRLRKKPTFENENPIRNANLLKPYQSIITTIQHLYIHDQLQASRLLNDFASELPKEDKSALAYWVAHDLHWPSKSLALSNTEDLSNQLSLRFPLAYQATINTHSKNYHIPQELIYAIIRQESAFRDDVVSPVGACGLMQIMPATASSVAKKERISYSNKKQLFLFDKNINIGVAYLKQLANRFNWHPVLMAAAYNAGPSQVNRWLGKQPTEIDIWIETIPWQETRNYLKNIVSFFAVYEYRLEQPANLDAFMKPVS